MPTQIAPTPILRGKAARAFIKQFNNSCIGSYPKSEKEMVEKNMERILSKMDKVPQQEN